MQNRYDILVNKQHRLPENYIPCDLVTVPIPFAALKGDPKRKLRRQASLAAIHLFERAKCDGMSLSGVSGFRSYQRQEEIFEASITRAGIEHTRKYIAPPGGSEHQTGLALDVSTATLNYELEPEFGATKEGIWLRSHAPLFGFIIRYPKDKEHITEFSYEPWHIRYVTKPLALCLTKINFTLEEYYNHYYC